MLWLQPFAVSPMFMLHFRNLSLRYKHNDIKVQDYSSV